MAELPLAVNVQGDYGYKVVVVDEDSTIQEVINLAAEQIVGVLVPQFPAGTVLRARLHGTDTPLANDVMVKQAGLAHMEALQIYVQ